MRLSILAGAAVLLPMVAASPAAAPYPILERRQSVNTTYTNSTTCNGRFFGYQKLAGYGFIPSNARDSTGDTIGGIGSGLTIDKNSIVRSGNTISGTIFYIPDRGWNTNGTLNYQNRIQKVGFVLTLNNSATVQSPSGPNIQLTYQQSILLTGPDGTPVSGLDSSATQIQRYAQFPGYPDLPVSIYTGDGFGGAGPGGRRISLDSEGITLMSDGSFWISDEYGPYVYHFNSTGTMIAAIRPPNAVIPIRNGTESFSAASPPAYAPNLNPVPVNPTSGRANNQGFEGLTVSPDGNTLYFLLQSACDQEGGITGKSANFQTRFFSYDITPGKPHITQLGEWVVTLPQYNTGKSLKTAQQSEIHWINNNQFFVLARDSGYGHGQSSSQSIYRHIDIFDISQATNIKGKYDNFNQTIANPANGALVSGITPALYCPFLDFNVNAQLNRFGLHNGGAQDANLLNEKWESIDIIPVTDGSDGNYLIFSASDNDFITQNGYVDFGQVQYADASGYNIDNQLLVFQATLPTNVLG